MWTRPDPRRTAPLLLLLLSAACGGGEPPEAAPDDATGMEEDAAPVEAGPQRLQGILTLEGEPELLLCDGTPYPVDGPAFPEMAELHTQLTPGAEPLEGIFVDVLAEVREGERGPWVDALALRRAAFEGWGCRDRTDGLLYRGSGTEPFWNLVVEEGRARWETPEGSRSFVHDGVVQMPRGGWELEARAEGGNGGLRAEFHSEPCRNAMSGAWSHLAVTVELGGETFQGCAFRGPEAEPGV